MYLLSLSPYIQSVNKCFWPCLQYVTHLRTSSHLHGYNFRQSCLCFSPRLLPLAESQAARAARHLSALVQKSPFRTIFLSHSKVAFLILTFPIPLSPFFSSQYCYLILFLCSLFFVQEPPLKEIRAGNLSVLYTVDAYYLKQVNSRYGRCSKYLLNEQ